ncbi:MAG: STAS domain-containing protein [Methylococcales bacterium]|nr:STAS domain-containing protein [Methylococcales bacterium]
MAKKNESSLIEYDPLAWMNTEEKPTDVVAILPKQAPDLESLASDALSAKVILQATQSIQNVMQLHEQLVDILRNTSDTIEVDASAITACDTATMQLFVVLKQEMLQLERNLVFDFPSDKFVEAADLLGVSSMLGVDKSAAGFF